tara:strand:+ start:560 stop:1390 length:831 start_codon:yes stop_codon:yes gene_type:complete
MSLSDLRCIMVCVDYSDILDITLAYNVRKVQSVLVVTHPRDLKTIEVCKKHEVECFQTSVFYEREAVFNKFAALELGLDYMGRHGWLAIMDADILLPDRMHLWTKREGNLYTPRRRMHPKMLQSVADVPLERRWRNWKYPMGNEEFAGYCQIFHASDPVLGPGPWHATNCTWAGTADSWFHQKWKDRNKVRPPFEVLHLGEAFTNWAGRVSPYADGTVPENAEKNADTHGVLLRQRRGKVGLNRFEMEMLKNETGSGDDHSTEAIANSNGFHHKRS